MIRPVNLSLSGTSLAWVVLACLGLSSPIHLANAQVAVVEANPVMIAGAVAQSTMATDLAALTAYLTGVAGTPPGNGLIALNSAIDSRLAGLNTAIGHLPANDDSLERLRLQDRADLDSGRARMPSYAKTNCYDVTMALSRSLSSSNTANMGRRMGAGVTKERFANIRDADRQSLVKRALEHTQFCTQEDITSRQPGCVGASVSQMPNADLLSSTLTRAPSTDPDGEDNTSNYSLNPDAQKAAEAFIQNVTPQTLPKPDPELSDKYTENQNVYLVNANRFNARMSPITEALAAIAAAYAENDGVVSYSEPAAIWNSAKTRDTYHAMFPTEIFPEKPSEMNVLRYEVFQQYADPTTIAARQSLTEKELAIEQLRAQALASRLNLRLLERTEDLIKIQAALLAQSLDPMTRSGFANQMTTPTSK